MRLTKTLLICTAALAATACRSADDANNNTTPDARVAGITDARGPDAPVGVTVKSINMGTPKFPDSITFTDVVVVAHVSSSTQGHVWVQDNGGGEASGFHIFCDYRTTASRPCAVKREFIDALKPGDVITVSGTFSIFNLNGRPDDWELIQPTITKKGTTVTPVALTVDAAAVAKDAEVGAFRTKYAGTYVRVEGPISIAKYQTPAYKGECNPVGLDGGSPRGDYFDNGFEGLVGETPIMIGFANYDTLDRCLPDCGFCGSEDMITETDTFQFVQGIAFADLRNTEQFVEIRPVVDANLPKVE